MPISNTDIKYDTHHHKNEWDGIENSNGVFVPVDEDEPEQETEPKPKKRASSKKDFWNEEENKELRFIFQEFFKTKKC